MVYCWNDHPLKLLIASNDNVLHECHIIVNGPQSICYGGNGKGKQVRRWSQQSPRRNRHHFRSHFTGHSKTNAHFHSQQDCGSITVGAQEVKNHYTVEYPEAGTLAVFHYITAPSIDPELSELRHRSSSYQLWETGTVSFLSP